MSDGEAIVVLCAVPADFDTAPLAATLIENAIAACVQVGAAITSTYKWKGVIETSTEKLLLIKTRHALFAKVEAAILAAHPYDVPEIIALPVVAGNAPYLAWLTAETTQGEVDS